MGRGMQENFSNNGGGKEFHRDSGRGCGIHLFESSYLPFLL